MKNTISQKSKLLDLLKDGLPHRTDEISDFIAGPGCTLLRIAARINDLKKNGFLIEGKKDPNNPTLYFYQLLNPIKESETTAIVGKSIPAGSELFNFKFDQHGYGL